MADHRHVRAPRARRTRTTRLALATGTAAVLATAGVVSVGVLTGSATPSAVPRPAAESVATHLPVRPQQASRDHARQALAGSDLAPKAVTVQRQATADRARRIRTVRATERAVSHADTHRYATADLNVWTAARAGDRRGLVADGDRVLVTGRQDDGRSEIVVHGRARWVTSGYLSADKPLGAGAGLSMSPCPDSAVESGLTSGAVYVYRSVCHAFPQVTSYGGYAPRGEHASGKAIDIMTSDVALGTAIAAFLQAHAAALDLYDIIWRQHIWTPVRAGEGWRAMSDRGSETANHFDHVHVSVN